MEHLVETDVAEAVLSGVDVDRLGEWQGQFLTVLNSELNLLLE